MTFQHRLPTRLELETLTPIDLTLDKVWRPKLYTDDDCEVFTDALEESEDEYVMTVENEQFHDSNQTPVPAETKPVLTEEIQQPSKNAGSLQPGEVQTSIIHPAQHFWDPSDLYVPLLAQAVEFDFNFADGVICQRSMVDEVLDPISNDDLISPSELNYASPLFTKDGRMCLHNAAFFGELPGFDTPVKL